MVQCPSKRNACIYSSHLPEYTKEGPPCFRSDKVNTHFTSNTGFIKCVFFSVRMPDKPESYFKRCVKYKVLLEPLNA